MKLRRLQIEGYKNIRPRPFPNAPAQRRHPPASPCFPRNRNQTLHNSSFLLHTFHHARQHPLQRPVGGQTLRLPVRQSALRLRVEQGLRRRHHPRANAKQPQRLPEARPARHQTGNPAATASCILVTFHVPRPRQWQHVRQPIRRKEF